jgi:hypothetical protein
LADGVEEFYKDFRNKNIHIHQAIDYVKDELQGKPANKLAEALAAYRRAAK